MCFNRDVFKPKGVQSIGANMRLGRITSSFLPALMMMALIIMVPVSSAASSGLSYSGGLSNPLEKSNSQAIDINGDNTLLATGYMGVITIHNIDDNSLIESFEFTRQIVDLKFSPDGTLLALSLMGSEARSDNIQLIDVASWQLLNVNGNSNSETKSISWSPDSSVLAVPNSDNGVDLLRKSDLTLETTLSGEHNTDVSCIAFSNNGAKILSGDESGRALVWDRQGNPTGKMWELDSEIVGCSFGNLDLRIGLFSENGVLKTVDVNGGDIHRSDFISGNKMQWSGDGTYIHIIEFSSRAKIITIETSTFAIIEETLLFHRASDFAIIENSNYLPERIFVTTDTQNVAIYGTPELPFGYGENGADLDGDGVPDHLDLDDDGDSITDSWDINCNSSAEVCSDVPNQDDIRNLNIWINKSSLEIEDIVTLSSQQSSQIRNMSRKSVIADQQLSYSETVMFSNSICKNMDTEDFVDSWKSAIELSVGQVENGVVSCHIKSGMTLTIVDDERTRIKIALKVSFTLFPDAQYPIDLSLLFQPEATDASIANLAEAHPVRVVLDGERGLQASWSPWWVEENQINLLLMEDIPPEPSALELFIEITIKYPWIAILVLVMFMASILTYIRTSNASSVDLEFAFDDFEDLSEDEMPEQSEDSDMDEEELVEEEELTHEEIMKRRQIKRKIGRKKSSSGTKPEVEFSTAAKRVPGDPTEVEEDDFVAPVKVRRRAGSVKRNKDGSVISGKRIQLGGTERDSADTPPVIAKKVSTKKKTVKTRRVVTGQSENQMMDDAISKLTDNDDYQQN